MTLVLKVPFLIAMAAAATAPLPTNIPDDEALNAQVSSSLHYEPLLSAPRFVVPASNLPPEVDHDQASNNNVALAYKDGRLYMAWRTGPLHFASTNVRMYVISSGDLGRSWRHETTLFMGSDIREPFFLNFKGRLILSCFQGGKVVTAFEPRHMWRTERLADGTWTKPEIFGRPGEIPWELKVRNGRAWMTSYRGDHYEGNGGMDVYFQVSDDGSTWQPVDSSKESVYHGGVSEVGFEFDERGDLWAITRNEDGDDTGFGSQVASAPAGALGDWSFPARSSPERFDSPRMFRHGSDIYLLARRDLGGPFDAGFRYLPRDLRKYALWATYGKRPKRTALYRLDTATRRVVHVMDLPSAGDTAFPSILRLDPDTYLIGNYTSPLATAERSWIWGQLSPQGTQIYLITLRFVPSLNLDK